MKKFAQSSEIPDEDLPENFSWQDIDGYDFTDAPRDQGHCGSCYTFSYAGLIKNRLQVKYGKAMPQLSPQQMMTCNYMTEGCDGGWAQFHGLFFKNAYMVDEQCAPYLGVTKGHHCSEYAECEPIAKVKDVKFVGGGYGSATEKAMMKEIMHSGAIEGEVDFPSYGHMYTSGVMTSNGMKDLHSKMVELAQLSDAAKTLLTKEHTNTASLSEISLHDRGIEWQALNHSILVIGWGTDPKTQLKYWIVRNSFGDTWGSDGNFMAERGADFIRIEGQSSAFDPVLCSEEKC